MTAGGILTRQSYTQVIDHLILQWYLKPDSWQRPSCVGRRGVQLVSNDGMPRVGHITWLTHVRTGPPKKSRLRRSYATSDFGSTHLQWRIPRRRSSVTITHVRKHVKSTVHVNTKQNFNWLGCVAPLRHFQGTWSVNGHFMHADVKWLRILLPCQD